MLASDDLNEFISQTQAQVDFTPSFPSLLDCEWSRLLRQLVLFQPAPHTYQFLIRFIRSEIGLTPVLKHQRGRWDGKRFVGLGCISISYEMQPFRASVPVEDKQLYTRSRFAQCTNSSTCTTAATASSTLFLAHPRSLPFLHALLSYITDREPGFVVYD